MAKKTVLVCLGEHRRDVCFDCDSDATNERKKLQEAVAEVFRDVLPEGASELLLQVKNESWAGEFVDLGHDSMVPNSSVLRAVCLNSQSVVVGIIKRTRHSRVWSDTMYVGHLLRQ